MPSAAFICFSLGVTIVVPGLTVGGLAAAAEGGAVEALGSISVLAAAAAFLALELARF